MIGEFSTPLTIYVHAAISILPWSLKQEKEVKVHKPQCDHQSI